MGPLKILKGMKLILDGQGNYLDLYTIGLESFRSFRGPLFCKRVTGQELFLVFPIANRLNIALAFLHDDDDALCS